MGLKLAPTSRLEGWACCRFSRKGMPSHPRLFTPFRETRLLFIDQGADGQPAWTILISDSASERRCETMPTRPSLYIEAP